MLKQVQKRINKNAVLYLLIYAILIRILMLLFYKDYSIFPDSETYIELGNLINSLDLTGYSGKRTPGYPALIALVGNNLFLVKILQLIFGIISTFLLFDLTEKETKNNTLAFFTAFFATSFIHFIFFEVAILTETTALFFLLLSFWFIKTKDCLNIHTSYLNVLIISILFACLYLVRPMFIYVPIIFSLFFLVKNFRYNLKNVISKSLLILIIPLFSLYSWSSVNKKNIGVFGSTYFLGINLTQNATPFFHLVPDDHKEIRELIVKHRDSIVEHTNKSTANAVWFAYDELLSTTKLKPHELSKKLGDISITLFKKHPDLYLKQVSVSWLHFWKESLLWKPQQIKSAFLKNILMGTWLYIQQWVAIGISILFIYFGFKKVLTFFKSKFQTLDFDLLLVAIVFLGSIAQALVTFGSNDRFSFPYFPLIVYFIFINLFNTKSKDATNT